jgi:hypothetical protein
MIVCSLLLLAIFIIIIINASSGPSSQGFPVAGLDNSTIVTNGSFGGFRVYLPENASNIDVIVTPLPTPLPMLPITIDISGFVLDALGNKVPLAYVTLYNNGDIVDISGNPMFSGDGTNNSVGYYSFVVRSAGNFTVEAEKSDIQIYNGTAAANVNYDSAISLDITLAGYVFSPMVTPTSIAPQPTIVSTPLPTTVPVKASADRDILSYLGNPLIIATVAFILILVCGVPLIFIVFPGRSKPVTQAPADHKGSDKSLAREDPQISSGYQTDLDELSKVDMARGISNPVFLDQINLMAKKYGVSQSKIFYDLKKATRKK